MSSISAGTTTTTGYVVTSDTTGALVLKTGASNTTAVTIDTSQNVGVGTSSPSEKLTVAGSVSSSSEFVIKSGTTAKFALGQTSDAFYIYSNAAGTERLRLDSAGNLGLGVTPSAWASAYKVIQLTDGAAFLEGGGNTYVSNNWFYDGTNKYIANGAAAVYGQSGGSHQWFTAASGTAGNAISFTQAMTLSGTDRTDLLIGTTTSTYSVANRGAVEINGSSTSILALKVGGSAGGYVYHSGSDMSILNVYNNALQFGTNNTERARISSGGELLVGTASALTVGKLQVANTGNNNIISWSAATGVDQQAQFTLYAQDGVRSAAFGLYRNGSADACAYVNFTPTNGGGGSFVWSDTSGVLRIGSPVQIGTTGGTVIGTQTSDERLKTIDSSFPYGLDTVNQLTPIRFVLNGEQQQRLGFGAQSTQPVVPEVVYDSGICIDGYEENPDDAMRPIPKSDRTRLMMDNIQLVPVLVKAIQEQQAIIQQLQADVAALKGTP